MRLRGALKKALKFHNHPGQLDLVNVAGDDVLYQVDFFYQRHVNMCGDTSAIILANNKLKAEANSAQRRQALDRENLTKNPRAFFKGIKSSLPLLNVILPGAAGELCSLATETNPMIEADNALLKMWIEHKISSEPNAEIAHWAKENDIKSPWTSNKFCINRYTNMVYFDDPTIDDWCLRGSPQTHNEINQIINQYETLEPNVIVNSLIDASNTHRLPGTKAEMVEVIKLGRFNKQGFVAGKPRLMSLSPENEDHSAKLCFAQPQVMDTKTITAILTNNGPFIGTVDLFDKVPHSVVFVGLINTEQGPELIYHDPWLGPFQQISLDDYLKKYSDMDVIFYQGNTHSRVISLEAFQDIKMENDFSEKFYQKFEDYSETDLVKRVLKHYCKHRFHKPRCFDEIKSILKNMNADSNTQDILQQVYELPGFSEEKKLQKVFNYLEAQCDVKVSRTQQDDILDTDTSADSSHTSSFDRS